MTHSRFSWVVCLPVSGLVAGIIIVVKNLMDSWGLPLNLSGSSPYLVLLGLVLFGTGVYECIQIVQLKIGDGFLEVRKLYGLGKLSRLKFQELKRYHIREDNDSDDKELMVIYDMHDKAVCKIAQQKYVNYDALKAAILQLFPGQ